MVKPSLPYLDIIADAAQLAPDHPIACYQVSGEFAMVHAGAKAGIYPLRAMAFETVEGMIRAGMSYFCPGFDLRLMDCVGATLILSYFTPEFLDWLDEA
jgi:porphobilinogen synthase